MPRLRQITSSFYLAIGTDSAFNVHVMELHKFLHRPIFHTNVWNVRVRDVCEPAGKTARRRPL